MKRKPDSIDPSLWPAGFSRYIIWPQFPQERWDDAVKEVNDLMLRASGLYPESAEHEIKEWEINE